MGGRWEEWPPARPIRVDGGIRAKSKRGAIGEQWWSRRFIEVLESYGMSSRLARGRSYARAGQVLDFELSQGKVTARVQGSRPRPYQVRIGVLPLTTAQWRRVLDRLAGQALFLLSLKAGGTGLNLTAASHVIHVDRWWNPAVEDQATDRAFRIGQRRNVQVRKFVCVGTLEERIDAMIEDKKALAEQIVGTGESWLTELSADDLRSVLTLTSDAVSE